MIKKTLLALGLGAAGFVALPAMAQDSTATSGGNYQPDQAVGTGNWTLGASVGRTNGSDTGGFGSNASGFNFLKGDQGRRTGYGVTGGYRWKVGNDLGLGLEAGYVDLGNYRVKNVFNSGDVNQRSTENALRGWTVGVNGKLNLVPQWYISARGGYFRANDNNTNYNNSLGQDLGLSSGGRPNRGSWYAGVGTGWDINQHWGVGVNYDYYHANAGKVVNNDGTVSPDLKRSTGIVSIAGEYRF
ncbi:OOP family OmpA-OmpF porin/outer membrane immunogenic protein [Luteibacter sp. Sphag1AF]|uniref:outer membrane protein n=1 Tax=Luteibacter sp. Sphag1AF TaxID=2587031 RepID=UPI0017E89300|nr:outer membrane beta-barrel protein [Luteibacter sp. Sphag1AF]MBB3225897.1 OOP family OmpA-OmpF porin/outer membrane immunogenic protein [Luteibacter sp. Sphag1AF]